MHFQGKMACFFLQKEALKSESVNKFSLYVHINTLATHLNIKQINEPFCPENTSN